MTDKKPLSDFADERDEARFAENAAIKRELNAARANFGAVDLERRRLLGDLDVLQRIYDEALILQPQPGWMSAREAGTQTHRATLVALLSDIHAGEVVRAEEMSGYNAFNLDICDARLRRFFDKTIMLAKAGFLGGVEFEGIVLAYGGDGVSGDIHDELAATNELSVLESCIWLAPRLVAGIEQLAEAFGKVHVVKSDGNHPRDSKTPRFKGRSAHNGDTHILKMAAMFFAKANPSASEVTFDIPESWDATFSVYDSDFALEHGDNMRFAGTSEIGALGPVKRGTLRKARQHEEEGHPFDFNLVGHFHQLVMAPSQGFVMNGSVKGYDEYARGWHLSPEPAQQALLVVTPENGITAMAPVLCADRDSEGW